MMEARTNSEIVLRDTSAEGFKALVEYIYTGRICLSDQSEQEYPMGDHYKEAFERFYPDLLKSLPMTDPHFYVELKKKSLFFGDLSEEVKAKDTEAQKAAHFLQNTIDLSLKVDNTEPFVNLLEVMEGFDNEDCKSLAKEIRIYTSTRQSPGPQTNAATIQPHPSTTGVVDNGPTHSELAVFEENYALLRNIITDIINPLMKCCVEKNLFTGEEQREIAAITEASDKLLLLLFKISNSLKADDTRGFYVMLKVMKEHGGKGTQSLADHIINKLKISCDQLLHICNDDVLVQNDEPKVTTECPDIIERLKNKDSSVTLSEILVSDEAKIKPSVKAGSKRNPAKSSEITNVQKKKRSSDDGLKIDNDMKTEFLSLVQKLKKYWNNLDISTLKELCINDTALTQLKKEIQKITASDSLIDLLTEKRYCSCLELRHVSRISEKLDIPEAITAINNFVIAHHKRKICEFDESLLNFDHKYPDDFMLVTVKLNLRSQKTSIEDLTNCCKNLEKIASLPDCSYVLNSFKVDQGIEITLIISSFCHPCAYVRTKDNHVELRHLSVRYVQFVSTDSEIIFANELTRTKKSLVMLENVSSLRDTPEKNPSEVISDYYTYLENHMDADYISLMMHSTQLLTDDDYEAVTAAPNDLKMNSFLLQYIMQYAKSPDKEKLYKFCDILKGIQRSSLNIDQHTSGEDELPYKSQLGIKSTTLDVHLELMDLIDKIFETNVLSVLAEKRGKSILACTNPKISLFSEEYLNKLAELASSKSISILKVYLLPFVTWFNYSVLSELVKESGDNNAVKLLERFKSLIDVNQQVTSYPLPVPSQLIIPNNDSFTFMVTKCNGQIDRLHDIVNIQDLLITKWMITKNAIQLVAIKDVFVYWMIPTCIKEHVNGINTMSVQFEMWKENGVTISTDFPAYVLSDNSVTSDKLSTKGPFSFLNPFEDNMQTWENRISTYNSKEKTTYCHNLQFFNIITDFEKKVADMKKLQSELSQTKSEKDQLQSNLNSEKDINKKLAEKVSDLLMERNKLSNAITKEKHSCRGTSIIKVRHAKILFCGAPKSGKTTFAHYFKSPITFCKDGQPQKIIITKEGKMIDFQSEINKLIKHEEIDIKLKNQVQDAEEMAAASMNDEMEDNVLNVLTLQDLSCQPELINVLPDLNETTAVSFVVLNVSEGEKGLDKPLDSPDGKDYRQHKTKCTTRYLLKRLLASIKEFGNKEYTPETKPNKENTSETEQLENNHAVKQVLYFLGTFLEESPDGVNVIAKLNDKIYKWIKILTSDDSLPLDVFGYDGETVILLNLTVPEEEQINIVQKLRSKVLETLKLKAPRTLPLAWVLLESYLKEQKKICFSLHEIETMAKEILSNIKIELDLNKFLNFYHSFGTFLYFEVDGLSEYVITNPQSLSENIQKLVTCEFVKDKIHGVLQLNKLRYSGVFDENLLDVIDFASQGIEKKYFLNLLKHLKICAPYEKHFFMPSVLPPCSKSNDQLNENMFGKMMFYKTATESFKVEPLIIKFDVNIIPRGMFCLLVSKLKQKNPKWELFSENNPFNEWFCRFSDMVTFHMGGYTYFLSILDKVFYLEVYVRSKCKSSPPYMNAREAVTESLECINIQFGHIFNKVRYGFLCSHRNPSTKHFSFISEENIKDAVSATCNEFHKMDLEERHTVWFKEVDVQSTDGTVEQENEISETNDVKSLDTNEKSKNPRKEEMGDPETECYHKITHAEVYEKNYGKLVNALPMNDVTFTTALTVKGILPDSVGAHIKSLPTELDKAEYFLKCVISKSLGIDETDELENLITVMEECGFPFVKRLANKMKSDLR